MGNIHNPLRWNFQVIELIEEIKWQKTKKIRLYFKYGSTTRTFTKMTRKYHGQISINKLAQLFVHKHVYEDNTNMNWLNCRNWNND